MTTRATRDVLDMAVRPIQNFILDGTGTSSIDGTPIGVTTPDVGFFTNMQADNITITTSADFTGAAITGLQSYYADLAECYEAEEKIEAGTVVKIGGEKEIKPTDTDGDADVFGVVSTDPAFLLNASPMDEGDGRIMIPVVLVGRAPCMVEGPVAKGARLVATDHGTARVADHPEDGLTFARSLVDCNETEPRLVEVAIVTVK